MSRAPCGHDAPAPGCRWCEMATRKDARYARLWWGLELPPVMAGPRGVSPAAGSAPPACTHRGEPTGEQVECPSCGGGVRLLTVFACSVRGKCNVERRHPDMTYCGICKDRLPPAGA